MLPARDATGDSRMSFVMDRLYGQKTSDVFMGHVQVLIKKLRELTTEFSDFSGDVFLTSAALASAGVSPDIEDISRRIGESGKDLAITQVLHRVVEVPESGLGDHYVEFSSDGHDGRLFGQATISGVAISLKGANSGGENK